MRLTPGTRVGPYEVLALLGHGGMAEVYRARDTRLGRDVALKVVSEALSSDAELLGRFEQEARLAGSLNHPNVVAVHDVGLHEGSPFFVTELLEGQTLRERLARGPLPLGTALDWAVQMAQGLAAAHDRGIAHRDLKPENVFVTRDGHVKLLDFGIAKLLESARKHGTRGLLDATVSPSGSSTGTGTVMGTPGYMSPEQVRSDLVDARTDFFSFGSVLYEMLSGRRAFPGGALVESGHAILHDEPQPLPPNVPAAVSQVVFRCLEKDPDRRFQSARDLAFNLALLRAPTGSTPSPAMAGPRRLVSRWRNLGLLVASLAAATAAFFAGKALHTEKGPPDVKALTFRRGAILAARFGPDEKTVYFSGSFGQGAAQVHSTSIASPALQSPGLRDAQLLAVSKSGELAVALHPRFIWFDAGRGTLARVPALGGTPRELATDVEYADWAPDGERLAIARYSAGVGTLEFPVGHVLFQSTGWVSHPRVSPSGDFVAFINHPISGDSGGEVAVVDLRGHVEVRSSGWDNILGLTWSIGSKDLWFTSNKGDQMMSLHAVSPDGRERVLYRGAGGVILDDAAADGTLLVTQADWRQELEIQSQGHASSKPSDGLDWSRLCCNSDDGKVVVFDESASAVANVTTVFLRRSDELSPVKLGTGGAIGLSPDGKWVAAASVSPSGKLWLLPTGAGESRAIEVPKLQVISRGAFFPNGKQLALIGRESLKAPPQLVVLTIDTATVHPLSTGTVPSGTSPTAVSVDGRYIATVGQDGIINLARTDGGEPVRLSQLGESYYPAGWLTDGSLVASSTLGLPASVVRVDPATGKVTPWTTVMPQDPAGVERVTRLRVTPDGKTLFLNYRRLSGTLYTLSWGKPPE